MLLIFDFDGTLADTWRDIATALNQTLREAGHRAAADAQVRAWIGKGVVHLIERALPDELRSAQRVAALYERFCRHYLRCCLGTTQLYPGVAACLSELAGYTLAILSNKPKRFLDQIVDGLGLGGRFAAIVGGDELPFNKPDPRAVVQLASALHTPLAQVWVIGDSALDVSCGAGAGARTIGCAWGLRGRDELSAAGAEFVVDVPAEIPPLIARAAERTAVPSTGGAPLDTTRERQ